LGAAYKAMGWRLRAYPAHPSLIRVADRSPFWDLVKQPGMVQKVNKQNASQRSSRSMRSVSRHGAVFEYCGPAMEDKNTAESLITGTVGTNPADRDTEKIGRGVYF